MKFRPDYKSVFRILKGGKVSLVVSALVAGVVNTSAIADTTVTLDGSYTEKQYYSLGEDINDTAIINVTGTIDVSSSNSDDALKVEDSGDYNITITNSGTIKSHTDRQYNRGIYLEHSSKGTINNLENGIINAYTSDGYATYSVKSNSIGTLTVENRGSMIASGGKYAYNVLFRNDDSFTITNYGSITGENADETINFQLININKNFTLINEESGTIQAQANDEARIVKTEFLDQNGSFTISNAGEMSVNADEARAFYIHSDELIKNASFDNSGTISLTSDNDDSSYGLKVRSDALENSTLENTGTIEGNTVGTTEVFDIDTFNGTELKNSNIINVKVEKNTARFLDSDYVYETNISNTHSVTLKSEEGTANFIDNDKIIKSNITNSGTVSLEGEDGTIFIKSNKVENSNIINSGTINQITYADDQHSLYLDEIEDSNFTNSGTITVEGDGSLTGLYTYNITDSNIINTGIISVNTTDNNAKAIHIEKYTDGSTFRNDGVIEALRDGKLDEDSLVLDIEEYINIVNNGTLRGNLRLIDAEVTNNGTLILPATPGNDVDAEDFTQSATGTLSITLESNTSYTIIDIDNNATFANNSTIHIDVTVPEVELSALNGFTIDNFLTSTNLSIDINETTLTDNSESLEFTLVDDGSNNLDLVINTNFAPEITTTSDSSNYPISVGGSGRDTTYDLDIDKDDNLIAVGYFDGENFNISSSGVDFNITSDNGNDNRNSFIMKYDSNGSALWGHLLSGESDSESIYDVATDSNGNIYATGIFSSGTDINGTEYHTTGDTDMFLWKLDSNGSTIWFNQFSANGDSDKAYGVDVDSQDNIYITGQFQNTLDINGTVLTSKELTTYDTFVAKFDSNGSVQWAQRSGGDADDYSRSVRIDNSGNVFIGGYYESKDNIDVDGNTSNTLDTTTAASDGTYTTEDKYISYVTKYNSSGEYQWNKMFLSQGGGGFSKVYDIGLDSDGNVYATGYFDESIDFNPETNTTENNFEHMKEDDHGFLVKLNNNGEYQWHKRFGADADYSGDSIGIDKMHVASDDTIYLLGEFENNLFPNPSSQEENLTTNRNEDMFVIKLGSDGDYIWSKQYGAQGDDSGDAFAEDSEGNIFVSGDFANTIDVDPTKNTEILSSNGSDDIFILKINSSGSSKINDYSIVEGTTDFSVDFNATDPEDDPITFSLTGEDASEFNIDPTTGKLSHSTAFTFSLDPTFNFNVRATDSNGKFDETPAIVTILNVAPTDIMLSSNTIEENSDIGTNIGTLSSNEADTKFAFNCATEGSNDNNFTITGTKLVSNYQFDYETTTTQNVCIRVTDIGGATYDENFTINITNTNEQPSLSALSNIETFEDNNTIETITLSATDNDGDALVYRVTSSNTDVATVSLTGDKLSINPISNAYGGTVITVEVDDNNGLTHTQTFDVNLSAVNDTPIISQYDSNDTHTLSYSENSAIALDFNATDVDATDSITYIVTGDSSYFTFTETNTSGFTVTSSGLDYEDKSSYELNITATDSSGAYDNLLLTIAVEDINESKIGVCGSSHNQTYIVAPTENLCSSGEVSTLVANGDSFDWTCTGESVGIHSGGVASCSALIGTEVVPEQIPVPEPTPEPEIPLLPEEPIIPTEPETPTEPTIPEEPTIPTNIIDDQGNFDEDPTDNDIDVIIVNDSDGDENNEVINKKDTGKTLGEVADNGNGSFKVEIIDNEGEKAQQEVKFSSENISSTTTENGVELKSILSSETNDVTTKVELNTNGTFITSVVSKDRESGNSKASAIASFKPEAQTEVLEDGSVMVTTEEIQAKVNADGSTEHKIKVGEKETKATSQADNTVTAILEDGTVQTKARVTTEDKKEITVAVDGKSDGRATHLIKITDSNGEEIFTRAESQLPGATSTISESGNVETTVQSADNAEAKVTATTDGRAIHQIVVTKEDGTTITSQAEATFPGASTTIGSDGSLETTAKAKRINEQGEEFEIRAIAKTTNNGETITRFEKVNLTTGETFELDKTISEDTPFEEGNEVEMTESEVDGLNIKVRSDVTRELTIE